MSDKRRYQDMVSKISHELRNPLTSISSMLQIIEGDHPEAKKFKYWPELMQDILYMRYLLDDLSSFNETDRLNISTFSFRSFLEHISLSFAASIANTEVEYTSKIDPSINQITGDKTKLQEVFLNLLRNALDASDGKGSVRLDTHLEGDQIIVTLSDTGCGIPEDKLPTIFDSFITYKKNGTGLGLTISKEIIEEHHGTIEVSSVVGEGTTIKITLPAEQEGCYETEDEAADMCPIINPLTRKA